MIFYLAGVIIGIGRGSTEAVKFQYKNQKPVPEYINTHSEYHTFTLVMWFGIILLCIGSMMIGRDGITAITIAKSALITFFAYYLPYILMYNRTRGQKWFYYKYYMFDLFGKTIKIPYINKHLAIVLNIFSLILSF